MNLVCLPCMPVLPGRGIKDTRWVSETPERIEQKFLLHYESRVNMILAEESSATHLILLSVSFKDRCSVSAMKLNLFLYNTCDYVMYYV